ncbi:MAG: RidA family protein [Gammaproteobacteria bacterium]|nr:RidA family protein [Gammaproteobacteria bacterium]
MEIKRINPVPRWSDATIYNGIIHFVEVPESDTKADMTGQMQQVLEQAELSLQSAGSDKSRILSVTIYVTNFADLDAMNRVWEAWLPNDCAPSRACLKVELVDPDYKVEIAFVAAQ